MLAASNPPVRSRSAFLDALGKSGLLTAKQCDRASAKVELDSSAEDAAHQFVRLGLLTSFQAKRILAGKTDGFLLGPYEVLEPIGQGRGGKVYRARHRTMNRVVAIKLLTPERTRSTAFREAFQSATRAAVQLVHPHIVTTYDANQCDGRMYAVLEYVPGCNLETLVHERGPLSVELACECARHAALALQYAHDRGVVHGLLNPGNLLYGRPGADSPLASHDPRVVKVLNFGYGRLAALAANDATGQLDGAMAVADYLAPELFDPKNAATPASDLFSLGCILHFLLAGRPPAGDGPIHQLTRRHGVERWRPGLSQGLVQLVGELLEQNPARRPTSAGAVAVRLEALARNRGTDELPLPLTANAEPVASPFDGLDREAPSDSAVVLDESPPSKSWSVTVGYALAAFVILSTGSAIALVLRSAVR